MSKTMIRLSTCVAAVLAAGLAYGGLRLAGVDLATRTVQPALASVLLAAAISGAAGWGVLALLERFTDRARTGWTIIAAAVLLLSLLVGPPSGVGAAAKVGLAGLHLVVGAVVIVGLRRSVR